MSTRFKVVAVVGAGAMGRGIAQIAAQAGSQVLLFDTQSAACQKARESIIAQWGKLAEKGRLTAELVQQYSRQLQCVDSLQALSACDLVIEAIVERLDILSVTAIAAKLKRPQRVAGYHFLTRFR